MLSGQLCAASETGHAPLQDPRVRYASRRRPWKRSRHVNSAVARTRNESGPRDEVGRRCVRPTLQVGLPSGQRGDQWAKSPRSCS